MANRTARRYADVAMQREIERDDARREVTRLTEDGAEWQNARIEELQTRGDALAASAVELANEVVRCKAILAEHLGLEHPTLEDAVRNLAQAYVSERDSARLLETKLADAEAEIIGLTEPGPSAHLEAAHDERESQEQ